MKKDELLHIKSTLWSLLIESKRNWSGCQLGQSIHFPSALPLSSWILIKHFSQKEHVKYSKEQMQTALYFDVVDNIKVTQGHSCHSKIGSLDLQYRRKLFEKRVWTEALGLSHEPRTTELLGSGGSFRPQAADWTRLSTGLQQLKVVLLGRPSPFWVPVWSCSGLSKVYCLF